MSLPGPLWRRIALALFGVTLVVGLVAALTPFGAELARLGRGTPPGRGASAPAPTPTSAALGSSASRSGARLLPSQAVWRQGASSFVFGTNDTGWWSGHYLDNTPAAQQALRDAHFTLMRTFFFDDQTGGRTPSDAEIDQRLRTIQDSGMVCLGVLWSTQDVTFDEHVVRYAGDRCNLYEFGNEPDNPGYENISADTYAQRWIAEIPRLRQINPNAKFIGPSVMNPDDALPNGGPRSDYVYAFLMQVKAAGVLPDAVSFHYYACQNASRTDDCLSSLDPASPDSYSYAIAHVRGRIQDALGYALPIGITEWNIASSSSVNQNFHDDPSFAQAFTTKAITSMIQSGLDVANQFTSMNNAENGGLDMFDASHHGQPKPQFAALRTVISQYYIATEPASASQVSSPANSFGVDRSVP